MREAVKTFADIMENRLVEKTMIKTKLIKPPTQKVIEFQCLGCGHYLWRKVPLDEVKGEVHCSMCGAMFEWEEEEK